MNSPDASFGILNSFCRHWSGLEHTLAHHISPERLLAWKLFKARYTREYREIVPGCKKYKNQAARNQTDTVCMFNAYHRVCREQRKRLQTKTPSTGQHNGGAPNLQGTLLAV